MSYTPIKIQELLVEQKKEKERVEGSKNDPIYGKIVEQYDGRWIADLKKVCAAAEANNLSRAQYIENHRANMENTIHSVEALLKKKEFDRFAYQEVNAAHTSLPPFYTQIMHDGEAFKAANSEYFGNWVKEAEALLLSQSQKSAVAQFAAHRQAWLGRESDRQAAVARCREYVVRILEYFKQATQRMNRIEDDQENKDKEEKDLEGSLSRITVQIQTEAKTILQLSGDMAGAIKRIKESATAKTWDAKLTGEIKPKMAKLAANAKTGRGHLKTCEVLLAGLQKRSQAVPEFRAKAAEILRTAQQPYIKAMETIKALDKEEMACATICKSHGVRV